MSEFREGVYFSMPEAEYHAVPALSASGMKNLRQSTLDFWVRSNFNPRLAEVLEEEAPSEARDLGKAFHKRILEGRAAFDSLYVAKIEPEDYPGVLKTADDIKAILRTHDLPLGGKKEDLIARLLEAKPDARIWDRLESEYAAAHTGKTFLTNKWLDKIEIAAAMVEKHPALSKAFSGGAPEVSIFWKCPVIGVNCKARLDYLKAKAIVDLKTMAPMPGTPLNRAVAIEFGRRRYFVQAAFYAEAAAQIAGFIKEGKVFGPPGKQGIDAWGVPDSLIAALGANHPKTFMFVFQVKGVAPAAIGRTFPAESMIFQAAKTEIDSAKMLYRTCLEKYGPDVPWVEDSPIEAFADEDVPTWSLT